MANPETPTVERLQAWATDAAATIEDMAQRLAAMRDELQRLISLEIRDLRR